MASITRLRKVKPPVLQVMRMTFTHPHLSHVLSFLARAPANMLFVTVSGAHLYGFDSADSDVDLRGCHVLPARDMLRLASPSETFEIMDLGEPVEVDLVSHDAKKFFGLLLGRNGYVLEQIFSPLVIRTTPEHEELKVIAKLCITKHHRHHYRRFADNQWETVVKTGKPTVKGLLYTFRALLAGIHLMRTGEVEANLMTLNTHARIALIDDLIARKRTGSEKMPLSLDRLPVYEQEMRRLGDDIEEAAQKSGHREQPQGYAQLDDLLLRLRL